MKTLIRMFKDHDKNIVFRDCQMHYILYLFEKKEILLIFFRHFLERPAKTFTLSTIIGLLLSH